MDNKKTNQLIVEKLIDLNLTISTCESMTGGLVANNLVQIEHASNVFLGGLVTYSAASKVKLAKVPQYIVDEYGTVSTHCAKAMVEGTQKVFNTDIAISVTGNASTSNPIEGQPSGMAYVGIRLFDKTTVLQFISNYESRIDTINECVAFTLINLWEMIKDLKK